MTIDPLNLISALSLAAIAAALWSGKLVGPQGIRGEKGEPATVDAQAAPAEEPSTPERHSEVKNEGGRVTTRNTGTLCEMLLNGAPTGHFVTEGDADYREALATPGLSVRHPDGHIEDGVQ